MKSNIMTNISGGYCRVFPSIRSVDFSNVLRVFCIQYDRRDSGREIRCHWHICDVIKLRHFHVTSPLWGESTGQRWIPLTKAIDVDIWCSLWSAPEQTVEQTSETPVVWNDAIALIMTSLYWGHLSWMCHCWPEAICHFPGHTALLNIVTLGPPAVTGGTNYCLFGRGPITVCNPSGWWCGKAYSFLIYCEYLIANYVGKGSSFACFYPKCVYLTQWFH